MNYNILTVDDEEHILELIEYNLMQNGFHVRKASCGEEALHYLNQEKIDLVLLDIMMEGMDGLEVLRYIRKNKELENLPVILLTAKTEERDKVLGLNLGADDYISKPFGINEMIARIHAVLRRTKKNPEAEKSEDYLANRDEKEALSMNKVTRQVLANGQPVDLALKEFELLYLLVNNKGVVYSREQILERVWEYEYYGETRTVDVHIRSIRKKLEEKGLNPECIKTVRGVGYKFQMEE